MRYVRRRNLVGEHSRTLAHAVLKCLATPDPIAKELLRRPGLACAIRESRCLGGIGADPPIEHLELEPDAVATFVLVHSRPSHRLNDEMNVSGHGVHVRPQRDVHLLGSLKRGNDCCRLLKHHSEFHCLGCLEVRDMHDMTIGFDDQRPDAERADAVIDEPVLCPVDAAAVCGLQGDGFTGAAIAQEAES